MSDEEEIAPRTLALDEAALRGWPLPQANGGDKEARGRVLIVAGSSEIPGAAVLAATAALRAGAGKVTIATPASIARPLAFAVPEARVIALQEKSPGVISENAIAPLQDLADKVAALLVGPGLSYDDCTPRLTLALIRMFERVGIVADAAAMDVAQKSRGLVSRFSKPILLTPHAGEMAKLTGLKKDAIVADPEGTARTASKEWNAVVALKGAMTYIAAPDARVWRHQGGNSGLATSGSGDVLAGLIAGLIARGATLEQAAAWGVALHARAGERLAQRLGPLGYLARELPAEVPSIMGSLS
jgi:ADP-dependent NAD(P)H-hydrate dehydratase